MNISFKKVKGHSGVKFNELVDKYLKSVKPKIRARTYKTKVTRFKRALIFFDNIPINKINNKMVDEYINTLLADNLSTETINNYKKELSTLFNPYEVLIYI